MGNSEHIAVTRFQASKIHFSTEQDATVEQVPIQAPLTGAWLIITQCRGGTEGAPIGRTTHYIETTVYTMPTGKPLEESINMSLRKLNT